MLLGYRSERYIGARSLRRDISDLLIRSAISFSCSTINNVTASILIVLYPHPYSILAFAAHYSNKLAGQPPPQLLLHVDGVARSGKTSMLLKTSARIQELAQQAGKPNPVFKSASTGIVAFNIIGRTLHALLWLPVKGKKSDLSIATLQSLQFFSGLSVSYY